MTTPWWVSWPMPLSSIRMLKLCPSHVEVMLRNHHFGLWVLFFFNTLMTWYVSHDHAFPSVPTFGMFATTMVLCNFSERTRCSVGALSHLRTCFLYFVLFHSWTCAFSFPFSLFFLPMLIPLSCLRCTWSDFIFTTVPFSVWDTFGEHSYVTTSCCVCGPCHFPIFSVLVCGHGQIGAPLEAHLDFVW